MSQVLLIGCDPADAAILESNLRQARHQTYVHDLSEGGLEEVLSRPWDGVVTPSRGPAGSFRSDLGPALLAQVWRPLATVLVYESPLQEPQAGEEAMTHGADLFIDRTHIEALVPALESGLRRARRVAEQVERVRQGALRLKRLRSETREHGETQRESAPSYGCMLVDREGIIVGSDPHASQLLGCELRGAHLAQVAPDGALVAPFRAALRTPISGDPFDVSLGEPGRSRRLNSVCIPTNDDAGSLTIVVVREVVSPNELPEPSGASLPASWVQSVTRVRRSMGASRIHAQSSAGAKLRREVRDLADTRTPFAIVGEPGVMRSHIARCVHYENPMASTFHEVRSQAFSDHGLEAELFGSSGAIVRLESSDTLLVTHLESAPEKLQRRLFASLDPTGSQSLRARLIVSADTSLDGVIPEFAKLLASGALHVPSLRQRPEDLVALAQEALAGLSAQRPLPMIHHDAIAALRAAHFPRNFDDLEAALRVALGASTDGVIDAESLPAEILRPAESPTSEWCQAPWSITDADPVSFEVYERKAIQRALASCRGDKVAAAQMLDVGRSTLYRKLRSLGLEA